MQWKNIYYISNFHIYSKYKGPSLDSIEEMGIIPRMMHYVFEYILNSSVHSEFLVKVSYLEIYNEKL
jgi:hypothetical protein